MVYVDFGYFGYCDREHQACQHIIENMAAQVEKEQSKKKGE